MRVLFVNENTLGHGSYLRPYAEYFRTHPDWEIEPVLLDVTPLPPQLARRARSIRGLRRFDLDFGIARWREAASTHAAHLVRQAGPASVILANTQSVALHLAGPVPLVIALDATFRGLQASPWFSPTRIRRLTTRYTTRSLIEAERRAFERAHHLLPWSRRVGDELERYYGVPRAKVTVLGPAVRIPGARIKAANPGPRLLFVGGDFQRKGGPSFLKVFRERFASWCEADIVTNSAVDEEPGVRVHRDVEPWSPRWVDLWQRADVFVFPSRLETYGIVVLEALAFQVPVVATPVGAVRELLAEGQAGYIVESSDGLGPTIEHVLRHPEEAAAKSALGYRSVRANHSMDVLGPRLGELLRRLAACRPGTNR